MTTPTSASRAATRCVLCGHPAESHAVVPETGLRPCRSVGHPKGLNCADCRRLTSDAHIAEIMALREERDPVLAVALGAFTVTRDHVRQQLGEAADAFFTDVYESAVASALIEIRSGVERQVREQVAREIEETVGGEDVPRPRVERGGFLNDVAWAVRIARGETR